MKVVEQLPTLLQIRDAVRTEVEHLMGRSLGDDELVLQPFFASVTDGGHGRWIVGEVTGTSREAIDLVETAATNVGEKLPLARE